MTTAEPRMTGTMMLSEGGELSGLSDGPPADGYLSRASGRLFLLPPPPAFAGVLPDGEESTLIVMLEGAIGLQVSESAG